MGVLCRLPTSRPRIQAKTSPFSSALIRRSRWSTARCVYIVLKAS
jgi:hypothetical protein